MDHSEARTATATRHSRRWLLVILVLILFMGSVTAWMLMQDRRASVTLRIESAKVDSNGQVAISYSIEVVGRKVSYALEERRPNGQGSASGSQNLSMIAWALMVFRHRSSRFSEGTGYMTLSQYPAEIVPQAGTTFTVYSREKKVIMTNAEGPAKSELTLSCE